MICFICEIPVATHLGQKRGLCAKHYEEIMREKEKAAEHADARKRAAKPVWFVHFGRPRVP